MKKLISCVMAVCMLLSFSACGLIDVYAAKEKTFTKEGMSITLTSAFSDEDYEGYTACYDSIQVAVFTLREPFADFEGLGIDTVKQYGELVRIANADSEPGALIEEDGLLYFEYTAEGEEEGLIHGYMTFLFKGPDAFWIVQFCCEEDDFADRKADFKKSAKTVTFAE
ncbi:MAG: hypothetical protein E7616_10140 [Ruminococcaceae bacterium]|nr:hypothetical protein [Oscillospiraceae bacterium]